MEDDLGDAFAIAQINEHAAAVIAMALDPTEENDLFSFVRGAQLTAVVRPFQLVDEPGHLSLSFPDAGAELSLKTAVRKNWLEDLLVVCSGAIPATWAVSRAPLAFDVAHSLGAARTTRPA